MILEMAAGGAGKTTKYTYVIVGGHCACSTAKVSYQKVGNFWEAEEARPFHDETLMEATKTINQLLKAAAEKSPDPERELCFLEFQGRPLLAWSKTTRGALTADDDPAEVARALGLRYDPSAPATA